MQAPLTPPGAGHEAKGAVGPPSVHGSRVRQVIAPLAPSAPGQSLPEAEATSTNQTEVQDTDVEVPVVNETAPTVCTETTAIANGTTMPARIQPRFLVEVERPDHMKATWRRMLWKARRVGLQSSWEIEASSALVADRIRGLVQQAVDLMHTVEAGIATHVEEVSVQMLGRSASRTNGGNTSADRGAHH